MQIDEEIVLEVNVKNTGKSAGKEVVQLYINDVESSVERPNKELKGFEKVSLAPGESKKVEFRINTKQLSFYDIETRKFKAEHGKFTALIGTSSKDIKQKKEFILTD